MTDSICGATKRDGSEEVCGQPAGWGTDHVGRGRCKLHGGKGGAPSGNQNASKHGLNSDPHHYYQSLEPEDQEWIDRVSSAILNRVRDDIGDADRIDFELIHRVAIELHILSRAENYIANESGLMQKAGPRREAAPLLEEVRQYGDSVMQNLKNLGALPKPDNHTSMSPQEWREFVEGEG